MSQQAKLYGTPQVVTTTKLRVERWHCITEGGVVFCYDWGDLPNPNVMAVGFIVYWNPVKTRLPFESEKYYEHYRIVYEDETKRCYWVKLQEGTDKAKQFKMRLMLLTS